MPETSKVTLHALVLRDKRNNQVFSCQLIPRPGKSFKTYTVKYPNHLLTAEDVMGCLEGGTRKERREVFYNITKGEGFTLTRTCSGFPNIGNCVVSVEETVIDWRNI